jgi:hypothetical protein
MFALYAPSTSGVQGGSAARLNGGVIKVPGIELVSPCASLCHQVGSMAEAYR